MLAPPSPPEPAVQIGLRQIAVEAGAAGVVVARSPVRMSFRDGCGRIVLAQVRNRLPAVLAEPPTVDPERGGVDLLPETTLYSPFTFTVGQERIEQNPGPGPFVGDLVQAERSGVQYSAQAVVGARRIGAGVRLELSTNDPSGRRLLVAIRPQGTRAIRVSVQPSAASGVSAVADSFASSPEEAFHGFGGRHNELDQRGYALGSFLNQTNLSAPAPPGAPGPPNRYMSPSGPTGAY